jgi:hypothetical protein
MNSAPFLQALGHLEAAVTRLERAARAAGSDTRLADLEERHRRLRDGASAALERLDRLIGTATLPVDAG